MPVVRIDFPRFSKMVGAEREKIIDRLPYVGLDIESVERNSVRVEYSPNRPDFGTDFGIARAMKGLLGKETGLPKFPAKPSGISVTVDRRLSGVRPFIACATATGLRLDDEDVRQLISLQEDLHNGLGRKRRAVAIGLHDMDAIKPPLSYKAVGPSFRFRPLDSKREVTVVSILKDLPEGRAYRGALSGARVYPVIVDSKGTVLSFPPIINGAATRVTTKTRSMFIDVTSMDGRAGDDVLAIVSTTLAEAGSRLGTVHVKYTDGSRVTPDLAPTKMRADLGLVKSTLGMNLTTKEIISSLRKSRLDVKGGRALVPRYRIDILHPVDIAEEVALGYGFDRLKPDYPASRQPGAFNDFENFLDSASTVMAESGMIEMMTFELTDAPSLYSKFSRPSSERLAVMDPKSIDHSVLRDNLLPTLMASLSGNVKSDYPQRVYEVGRVYGREKGGVSESWQLGCLIAHAQASFSEAKMYVESACRLLSGKEANAHESTHWAFSPGRCAEVSVAGSHLGHVGEVKPESIEAFGLGVPVSGFELNLSKLFELLK